MTRKSVRFYGDWEKVMKVFRKKKDVARKGTPFQQELLTLGDAIKRKVREHIFSQDLGWRPLSLATESRKGGGIIYFDSGKYIRGIRVTLRKGTSGVGSTTLMVGPYGSHSPGLQMKKLAAMLEYGTNRIPARPLWRPTMMELKTMPEYKTFIDAVLDMSGK